MTVHKKSYHKILVITLSNLGDVVLTIPIIVSLRKAFPDAEIQVVVGEKAFDLLHGNPALQKVICYRKESSLWEKLKFVLMLRAEKFDLVLDFKDTLLPYLLGKPSNNWWLNRQARKIPSRYERYQHIIKLLHLPTVDFSYLPLYVREDNDRLMRKLHSKGLFNVQNILLISPGARFLMKRWPARYFAALISSIVKKEEMAVILVGDDFDCAAAHEIEPLLTNMDVINLCGKITQKELAILVERARLVISNDSATMHFASFYKRPVVGIFGPTNVAKYGSSLPTARIARLDLHCIPCEESICKYKRECLEKLTPEKVLPLALELLQKTI